ncbi:MAG: hypothetical protein SPI53_02540 [Erysipelotrichaceae bacterium]|nr:hypothetical protein [Erysipelotrichaceae bacterium]
MIIELLITLTALSLMMPVSFNYHYQNKYQHQNYVNAYLLSQSMALKEYHRVYYQNGIYFNGFGNVNHARTLNINNHKVYIRIGNGSIRYE